LKKILTIYWDNWFVKKTKGTLIIIGLILYCAFDNDKYFWFLIELLESLPNAIKRNVFSENRSKPILVFALV
jgi:hypothetical protein